MGELIMPGTPGNWISAPDINAYDGAVSGRAELRLAAVDWSTGSQQGLMTQHSGGGADWSVQMFGGGGIEFIHKGGIDEFSAAPTLLVDGTISWVACEWVYGAGDGTVTFEESVTDTDDPDAVAWTLINQAINLTIPASPNTSILSVGARADGTTFNMAATFRRARYTVDGTVEFDADFTDLTHAEVDIGSFIEDSPNAATVTINGAAWSYVFDPVVRRVISSPRYGITRVARR